MLKHRLGITFIHCLLWYDKAGDPAWKWTGWKTRTAPGGGVSADMNGQDVAFETVATSMHHKFENKHGSNETFAKWDNSIDRKMTVEWKTLAKSQSLQYKYSSLNIDITTVLRQFIASLLVFCCLNFSCLVKELSVFYPDWTCCPPYGLCFVVPGSPVFCSVHF